MRSVAVCCNSFLEAETDDPFSNNERGGSVYVDSFLCGDFLLIISLVALSVKVLTVWLVFFLGFNLRTLFFTAMVSGTGWFWGDIISSKLILDASLLALKNAKINLKVYERIAWTPPIKSLSSISVM